MKTISKILAALLMIFIFTSSNGSAQVMDNSEKEYQELQTKQAEMTVQTWQQLQSHGITEETELILDFMYYSPQKEDAEKLKQFLENYEISIQKEENGELWVVEGKTSPTAVSEAILLQWVDYMVAAGWDYNCYFDGWGTEIPEN